MTLIVLVEAGLEAGALGHVLKADRGWHRLVDIMMCNG